MATVTKPIALDESFNTTELTPRNIADVLAQELSRITGRNASQVEYDNTDSGLTADNVQNAIDELKSDIPTVNDGTLTIQQNGETKGTFTANQSGNSTVNIEISTTDIQTAVDEFETYNGGLLSECKVALSPNQDLHGYDNPWVGGAGKNKWAFGDFTGNYSNVPFSLPAGTYTISKSDNNGAGIRFMGGSMNTLASFATSITITLTEATTSINYSCDSGTATNVMIESGSTATAYEPYENICPISGHTQVEVDVSDGQATQEQVTVNLGGTYYSGTLDVVSGVLTVDKTGVEYDGSSDEGWAIAPSDVNAYFYRNASDMTSTAWKYIWSESFKTIQANTDRSIENTIWGIYQQIHIHASSAIAPSGATSTGLAEFKTWLSNNPQKVVYELATPQSIQLSPTMVKALVGENHLSAPLDGQEITESKYKQMFTFDDVNTQIESTYSEGISHNSVYRGKYLGDHVTDEQWDAIGDGSFRDLYIGDYWAINGINWRIAHFNYWLGTGDVKCNTNHVVIVPYGWVSTFNMNATDDTTGGYLNSEWYTTNRHFAVENIEADFGASHILSHRNFFSDAVSDGHASHGMWVDSTVDLMNEIMVCGSLVGSYSGKYYEVGCDKFQLALFKYNPPSARMDVSYWLRGVSTASSFVAMGNFGLLDGFTASQILKIRPVFAIKK